MQFVKIHQSIFTEKLNVMKVKIFKEFLSCETSQHYEEQL